MAVTTPPPPPAPSRNDPSYDDGASPRPWWLVGFVALGLIAVAIPMLIFVGALVLGGSSPSPGPRDLPPVDGAPEADLVMVVTPIGATGAEADRRLVQEGGVPVVDRHVLVAFSAEHLADVATPYDDVSIYRWSEVEASTAPTEPASNCLGGFGASQSFVSCVTTDVELARPSISRGSTEGERGTSFNVTVTELPADAAWVRVRTSTGTVVASAVVDGVAHLEWPGVEGLRRGTADPQWLEVLNASHDEIFTDRIE